MSQLIRFAFTGFNIVTTVLFLFMILYWIVMALGMIDFDFMDLDVDLDLDGDGAGPLQGVLVFFNMAELPFMLVFSIVILAFWILSMLLYLLPVTPGGWINHLLLIPAFIISMFLAKMITNPLKKLFRNAREEKSEQDELIVGQFVHLNCDVKPGCLGQAEVKRSGASILINVMPEFEDESFHKDERVYVAKKDKEKNLYYIVKLKEY